VLRNLDRQHGGPVDVAMHFAELAPAVGALRGRRAFTDQKPVSSRLPFSYQRVPGNLRKLGASLVGRLQRHRSAKWAQFPTWPLDLSVDFLADLVAPSGFLVDGKTPVLVSHDIDTPEGLTNLAAMFLPLEETHGARSTNYIVPCGWLIDTAVVDDVVARGHCMGIHGFDHSNLTPFARPEERRIRLDAAMPFVARYGIIGYRAPSLLRTEALLQDLSGRYRYDSSIPTSGGLFPVPNNGCATARPYRLGGLWEIPLTLPRDGSLRFLGHSPAEILRLWQSCADRIARSGGIVFLLTHCEARFSGNPAMLAIYDQFLGHMAGDDRYRFMTAEQVVHHLETTR
jgi:peptidoglycan/xylan/chitin deacetylase (PgdA/CDA1 family)